MNNELAKKIEKIKAVGTRLKCGEYNGNDIMQAWLAIDELIDCKAALAQQQEDYEELQHQYHLLASEMVYEGNSVQHWRQKALAYKECAGVIYELKSLLGVETPADVLEQVKAQKQESEPVGHQLVPITPTKAMMKAFWLAGPYPEKPFIDGYAAMLSAATEGSCQK